MTLHPFMHSEIPSPIPTFKCRRIPPIHVELSITKPRGLCYAVQYTMEYQEKLNIIRAQSEHIP